eukprot:PLAT5241.1.p2 GENE.PLAT5241.1~~PLAT5241.1.p2  ORF type:complete len:216 (+),score=55.37 PLAT5241.1:58-648(+)
MPRKPPMPASVACCPRSTIVGHTVKLWGGDDAHVFPATAWVGADWTCLVCTYALVIGPTVGFFLFVAGGSLALMIIGGVLLALTLLFLSLTACSDPGMVQPRDEADLEALTMEEADLPVCTICNIPREMGVVHCYDCQMCVAGYDHHCPWTGTCIGEGNITYFRRFLTSICSLLVFVCVGAIVHAMNTLPKITSDV